MKWKGRSGHVMERGLCRRSMVIVRNAYHYHVEMSRYPTIMIQSI